MFFYEGQSCPVCGEAFTEKDDIVTCPRCGCPHHRACWKQEGHCHFADDHGTEHQWGTVQPKTTPTPAPAALRCPRCGKEHDEDAAFCAGCGCKLGEDPSAAQYTPPTGPYTPPFRTEFRFDLYGGVARDATIDGIPVTELAELIGPNAMYYLPRFLKLSERKSKLSWNGAAFLMPHSWLLFRKNLLWGSIASGIMMLISIASSLLLPADPYAWAATATEEQMLAFMPIAAVLFALSVVELALRFGAGLFGNYLYMRLILKKAHRLRETQLPQNKRPFTLSGGISAALAILPIAISYLVLYLIPLLLL